ncbi:hypothetical protein PMIN03_007221 [Paraphaeosphaeria minitans]
MPLISAYGKGCTYKLQSLQTKVRCHNFRVVGGCFPFRHVFPSCCASLFVTSSLLLRAHLPQSCKQPGHCCLRFSSETLPGSLDSPQRSPVPTANTRSSIMSDVLSSNMPTAAETEASYTEDQKKLVNNPLYSLLREFWHTL